MFKSWWNVALLAAESQQVIWLRFLKLSAGGPKAPAEFLRMASERMVAAPQVTGGVMTGDSPSRVVKRYRKKVRANRRRLTK